MNVIDFLVERALRKPEGPRDEERAREAIDRALPAEIYSNTLRTQAKARVVRSIVGGMRRDLAIAQVLKWALDPINESEKLRSTP